MALFKYFKPKALQKFFHENFIGVKSTKAFVQYKKVLQGNYRYNMTNNENKITIWPTIPLFHCLHPILNN